LSYQANWELVIKLVNYFGTLLFRLGVFRLND